MTISWRMYEALIDVIVMLLKRKLMMTRGKRHEQFFGNCMWVLTQKELNNGTTYTYYASLI